MKWHKNWKRIVKSYSFLGLLSNLLVAISLTLGTVAGMISSQVSLPVMITLVILVSVTGLVGRFIDQTEQDVERERLLECQKHESSSH